MSTSRTEDATRAKRTRDDSTESANAASGGAAAAPSSIDARLGPRLGLMKPALESQPVELQGTIISLAKEMLELRDALAQRKSSHARFDKPSKDPTTGEEVKDKAGNPLPFIPGSLRSKCPIKASSATNNDAEMAELKEEAEKMHAEYTTKMTEIAKRVSAREIVVREKATRTILYKLLDKMSLAHVISAEFTTGRLNGMQLARPDLCNITVRNILKGVNEQFAKRLGMDSGDKLAEEYETTRTVNHELAKDEDDAFIAPIVTKLLVDLPAFTTLLWDQQDQNNRKKLMEAEIKKELEKQATLEATEDVEMEMDAIDLTDPTGEALLSLIDKRVKIGVDKKTVQDKRAMRKKSSGEVKTATSKPTANGLKKKKDSAKRRKHQQEKQGTSKSTDPSKDKQSKQSKSSRRKQQKKSRGNQDGADASKGGDKRKSAGRR